MCTKTPIKMLEWYLGKKLPMEAIDIIHFFCATNVFENNFVYLMSGYF